VIPAFHERWGQLTTVTHSFCKLDHFNVMEKSVISDKTPSLQPRVGIFTQNKFYKIGSRPENTKHNST